jgi:hypothetical protein
LFQLNINIVVQRLFKETPRVQKYFAKFANVAVDALAGNADYEKQVALVADRLDSMVAALDDKLQILGNMNYMRYTHAARSIPRGVWEVYYKFYLPQLPTFLINWTFFLPSQDFGRLIFDVLSSKGLSADELNSWRGVLGVFLNGIAPKK